MILTFWTQHVGYRTTNDNPQLRFRVFVAAWVMQFVHNNKRNGEITHGAQWRLEEIQRNACTTHTGVFLLSMRDSNMKQPNEKKNLDSRHSPFSKLRFLQTSSSAIEDRSCRSQQLPPCVLDIGFISRSQRVEKPSKHAWLVNFSIMKQTAPQPLSPAVICGVDSLTITATVRTSSPSSARNTEAKKKKL